jgi:hypothetical protein
MLQASLPTCDLTSQKRALELEHVRDPEIAVQHSIVDTLGVQTSHFRAPIELFSDQFWHNDTLQSPLYPPFRIPQCQPSFSLAAEDRTQIRATE